MDWFETLLLIVFPPASFAAAFIEHRKKPIGLGSAILFAIGFIVVATVFNLLDERTNPEHSFTFSNFFLLKQATFASDLLAIGYGLSAFCLYLVLFGRGGTGDERGGSGSADSSESP